MKLHEWGKIVWGLDATARDVDVVSIIGWGDRRIRFDIGRTETIEGWQRRVTRVKGWKILRYGIITTSHDYFVKTWVH